MLGVSELCLRLRHVFVHTCLLQLLLLSDLMKSRLDRSAFLLFLGLDGHGNLENVLETIR